MLNPREESARCLLCHDAPCTAACPRKQDPARFIRAVRFDRAKGSLSFVGDCERCEAPCGETPCEKACVHKDFPLRVKETRKTIEASGTAVASARFADVSLAVDFCGIRCENPFFLSSSVVASGYDMCAAAFRAGWAGIVYKTIGFLRPSEVSPRFAAIGKEGTPFIGFRNLEQISDQPLAENLNILKRLKKDFPSKVIVVSIMGQSGEEWTELARLSQDAGADIIECNFSCPHMSGESLGSDVGQNPELVALYTAAARRGTTVPILAKMTPNLGQMEIPALAAVKAGADGLAAINTIKSITGLDVETLAAYPAIENKSSVSGYSGKATKPIALRFIHDMAKHPRLAGLPISGMGGIETWKDALEFIMLGCSNLQVTTSVMQYGYRIVEDLIAGLRVYMAGHLISSVSDMVGTALPFMVNAQELDRTTVVYPIFDRTKCVGCGRCHIACADAGHQAIAWNAERNPKLQGKKCVGCHLCVYVCPSFAISAGARVKKPAYLR